MPEVRGFRLGMTLQQLEERFPGYCMVTDDTLKDEDLKISLRVSDYSLNSSNKKNRNCSEFNYHFINKNQYPDLNGVSGVELNFNKNYLFKFEVSYEHTLDDQFRSEYHDKTRTALGLDQWTNWKLSESKRDQYDKKSKTLFNVTTTSKKLACNKSSVTTKIEEYSSNVRKTYFPALILEADLKAVEEEKKAVEEEKQRKIYLKDKEKYKTNTETFRP